MAEVFAILQQPEIVAFIAIGFCAQMCDGALGMGFGAISSTALAAIGMPPTIASASVNGAKIFTGLLSGTAHLLLRNVDLRMLWVLAAAGAAGALLGAAVLVHASTGALGMLVSGYLLLTGVHILWRTVRAAPVRAIGGRQVGGVGAAGGLLEALSGVWGPLVTSNLVAFGASPRYAIGTGNVCETLVAAVVFTVLIAHLGLAQLSIAIVGLLVGALTAAPFAALLTRRASPRFLTAGVGALVVVLATIRLVREIAVS
jgi:uncharacterized protein